MATQKISLGEKLAFGAGDCGCNFVWNVLALFMTIYYTDSVMISAAAVGGIMLASRIFDGISDLVMGAIIDKTKTRWGKARPWILWSAPFMAIALILTFSVPDISETGKVIYAFCTYFFLTVIVYTASNLPYNALLSFITDDQKERTSLSSIRFFMVNFLVIILSFVTPPAAKALGWFGITTIYGIIAMCCLLITFFFCKERVEPVEVKKENISFVKSLGYLVKNKYFIYLAIIFVIDYIMFAVNGSSGMYYVKYIFHDENIFGMLVLFGNVPMMLSCLFFPVIANRFGKWNCMIGGYVVMIIGFGIIALFPDNYYCALLGNVIAGIGRAPHNAGLFALVADVVDYGEWKTNKRIEGVTYSVTSFGMKVGAGLGGAVTGIVLAMGNYDGSLAVQSDSAITAIMAICAYIPIGICVLGILIMLTANIDKIYPQVVRDLAIRHATCFLHINNTLIATATKL